ncbi:MAG: 30S ribosomal protein S7 [Actinobacteria bacterium]|nr:30S ribosomal protein S7 [Actinomycetota bacterium]
MPRKGPASKREIVPDPVYNSNLVAQFISHVLQSGKKSLASGIIYKSLDIVKDKTKSDPLIVMKKAVDNAKPLLEVKSRRVGGATYQVPIEVNARRGTTLALRWLIGFAKARKGLSMASSLAAELIDASNGVGASVKKREDLHKMAEANRAFAHYKW